MQLIQVTIHGKKFEGNFLNPDVMENYEKAIEQANKTANADVEGETGSQGIRRQCTAICQCIDSILGPGSSEILMPDGPDLLTCLDIYEELCWMGERQITPTIQRHTLKYSAQRARRNAKSAD